MRPGLWLLAFCSLAGCAGSSRDRLRTLDPVSEERGSRQTRGFADAFDTKSAARVEVTPTRKTLKLGKDQLLIATVYDRDGNPRSRRKVEWTIDGPGKIVATDEGGFLPNRGRKVDSKYAVVYTNTFGQTVKRDDPRDDFEVRAGQTYCVVTGTEPGVTTVTAYSPEVVDEDKGRAAATLTWTDGDAPPPRETSTSDTTPRRDAANLASRTNAPQAAQVSLDVKMPRAVGLNQDVAITIALANGGRADSEPVTLRATIPDHAEFVRAEPAAIRRSGNTLTWAFETVAGLSNQDVALTLRPTRKAALNVTATAETADGLRAEKKASTEVDTAGLAVTVDAPKFAGTGEDVPVRVTVKNTGNVPVENAVAWVDLPDLKTNPIEKSVGRIGAKESKMVSIPVPVEKAGKCAVRVTVTADGGLAERGDATVTVGRAELDVTVNTPETIPIGQDNLFEFKVTNRGDAGLTDVKVEAALPRGITAGVATENGRVTTAGGANWAVGSLAPGESKVVRLNTTSERQAEKLAVTATADGELESGTRVKAKDAKAVVSIVGRPVLTLELSDPVGPINVGGRAVYRVTVRNRGNSSARDVSLVATATDELSPKRGSGPNRTTATVADHKFAFPLVSELPAGSTASFTLETEATKGGSARVSVEVKSRELTTAVKEEQATHIVGKR
jgi:uncharacterized repeat protein (TIGR01451 family)